MLLAVRISSYGYAREVWRARKMRKSCTRRAFIIRYTHAKHEQFCVFSISSLSDLGVSSNLIGSLSPRN